jgi:hypothetical protein
VGGEEHGRLTIFAEMENESTWNNEPQKRDRLIFKKSHVVFGTWSDICQ